MRIDTSADKIFLSTKDSYGNIINQPILVVAKTGGGKGLALQMMGEDYHNQGCIVIGLCDPKQEVELGFAMFEPEIQYHLDGLKRIAKKPEAKKVKLYHPFSFQIPTEYLPEYNFYTIPIKELGDGEWSLLAETKSKSDAVAILQRASSEISNNDGLYGFTDKINSLVKGNIKKGKKVADWSNFGFPTGSGTATELKKIGGYLSQFEEHGFLSSRNSRYNLDWDKIFEDQEHYHIFVTNFIEDTRYKKVIGFIILNLVQSIIRNKGNLKRPLVILIPELKNLAPFKAEGFQQFLAEVFTFAISTLRSAGISIVGDTQNWTGLSKEIKDVFKTTLLGELTGDDIEEVCKKWNLGKEYKSFLRFPPKKNSFVIAESDHFQPFTFYLPSQMHKEPIPKVYDFKNMYKKHAIKDKEKYPLKNYKELIKEIREIYDKEKKKYAEKYKKQELEEEKEEQKKVDEKESKSTEKEKVSTKIEKIKGKENQIKEVLEKLCYEAYLESGSYRKVADKFKEKGIKTHVTAKKYVENYLKKLNQENSKDFEEKFVEEEKRENNFYKVEGGEKNEI